MFSSVDPLLEHAIVRFVNTVDDAKTLAKDLSPEKSDSALVARIKKLLAERDRVGAFTSAEQIGRAPGMDEKLADQIAAWAGTRIVDSPEVLRRRLPDIIAAINRDQWLCQLALLDAPQVLEKELGYVLSPNVKRYLAEMLPANDPAANDTIFRYLQRTRRPLDFLKNIKFGLRRPGSLPKKSTGKPKGGGGKNGTKIKMGAFDTIAQLRATTLLNIIRTVMQGEQFQCHYSYSFGLNSTDKIWLHLDAPTHLRTNMQNPRKFYLEIPLSVELENCRENLLNIFNLFVVILGFEEVVNRLNSFLDSLNCPALPAGLTDAAQVVDFVINALTLLGFLVDQTYLCSTLEIALEPKLSTDENGHTHLRFNFLYLRKFRMGINAFNENDADDLIFTRSQIDTLIDNVNQIAALDIQAQIQTLIGGLTDVLDLTAMIQNLGEGSPLLQDLTIAFHDSSDVLFLARDTKRFLSLCADTTGTLAGVDAWKSVTPGEGSQVECLPLSVGQIGLAMHSGIITGLIETGWDSIRQMVMNNVSDRLEIHPGVRASIVDDCLRLEFDITVVLYCGSCDCLAPDIDASVTLDIHPWIRSENSELKYRIRNMEIDLDAGDVFAAFCMGIFSIFDLVDNVIGSLAAQGPPSGDESSEIILKFPFALPLTDRTALFAAKKILIENKKIIMIGDLDLPIFDEKMAAMIVEDSFGKHGRRYGRPGHTGKPTTPTTSLAGPGSPIGGYSPAIPGESPIYFGKYHAQIVSGHWLPPLTGVWEVCYRDSAQNGYLLSLPDNAVSTPFELPAGTIYVTTDGERLSLELHPKDGCVLSLMLSVTLYDAFGRAFLGNDQEIWAPGILTVNPTAGGLGGVVFPYTGERPTFFPPADNPIGPVAGSMQVQLIRNEFRRQNRAALDLTQRSLWFRKKL
ncbi:MAG TPA: hypothetical protein PK961_10360 [bacterium]|nr:hypothetical protein [bacterium]